MLAERAAYLASVLRGHVKIKIILFLKLTDYFFSGIIIHAIKYASKPTPIEIKVAKAQINLTIVGSVFV